MGPTDSGSHPGGAKKLLTAVDQGQGVSIDQALAQRIGADTPHRHVYLGVQAAPHGVSGDKHISYPIAGRSEVPEDQPRRAFERLFGGDRLTAERDVSDQRRRIILDVHKQDLADLRARVRGSERARLEVHTEALRELEARLEREAPEMRRGCGDLLPELIDHLYAPERFPQLLAHQTELLVNAFACGLTRVGVMQLSHHTSDLVMSRFSGTEMHDLSRDMRSHQASHYGPRHDLARSEYLAFVQQRRWYAGRFAALLSALAMRPEGEGTMLDHTLVLLCSEVSDGNTHLHDDMPFALAGGPIRGGQTLDVGYRRHGDLFATIGQALGAPMTGFGQESQGRIDGVLS